MLKVNNIEDVIDGPLLEELDDNDYGESKEIMDKRDFVVMPDYPEQTRTRPRRQNWKPVLRGNNGRGRRKFGSNRRRRRRKNLPSGPRTRRPNFPPRNTISSNPEPLPEVNHPNSVRLTPPVWMDDKPDTSRRQNHNGRFKIKSKKDTREPLVFSDSNNVLGRPVISKQPDHLDLAKVGHNKNWPKNKFPDSKVPRFVKEFLAKAFLKNPQSYLEQLRRESDGKKLKTIFRNSGNSPYYKTPYHALKKQHPYTKSNLLSPSTQDQSTLFLQHELELPLNSNYRTSLYDREEGTDKKNFYKNSNDGYQYVFQTDSQNPNLVVPSVDQLVPFSESISPGQQAIKPELPSSYRFEDYYDDKAEENDLNNQLPAFLNTDFPDYTDVIDYIHAPMATQSAPVEKINPSFTETAVNEFVTFHRNSICICCDETSTPRHYKNHAYSRRMLEVDSREEMEHLLTERAMLEEEIDCSNQEPIEVVLVFDSKKIDDEPEINRRPTLISNQNDFTLTPISRPYQKNKLISSSTTRKKRKNPSSFDIDLFRAAASSQISDNQHVSYAQNSAQVSNNQHVSAANDVYYDPTKLSFIFSTPSPLRKRYIELRDRKALGGGKETASTKSDFYRVSQSL